jgi:hypothetical protein
MEKKFKVKLSLSINALYDFSDQGKSAKEIKNRWIKSISSHPERYIDIQIDEINDK